MKFHVTAYDAKITKINEILDCGHHVSKGNTIYVLHDNGEPVMKVCKNCVIVEA
jgi:hypothetical protein